MTVRWGIIGPGAIATRFAEAMALVPDGELVAVASRSADRANQFAERFGLRRSYAAVDALLNDPDVDAVYVATPHSRHEQDTLACLEAGKHVLCEKPFAVTSPQARRMASAAQERGVFLMEAIWSRFLPAYQVLLDLVGSGRIGEVLFVEAAFGYRAPVTPQHRIFDPHLGGGALLDVGIYPLQLCSLLLGPPDRVVANASLGATGVDEQIAAVLHHPAGALGVVKAAIRTSFPCEATITGSEGWIGLPAFMHCPDHLTVGVPERAGERIDAPFGGNGLHYEIEEAHRCIAAGLGQSERMPLEESIRLAETMDAIRAEIGLVYPDELASDQRPVTADAS